MRFAATIVAHSTESIALYTSRSMKPTGSEQRKRVVVTGLGPICAFGVGIDALWSGLCEGRTAIAPISRFDASGFASSFAAELSDDRFDVKACVPKSHRKALKVMARDIELAVGAADAAVRDAGLVTRGTDAEATPTIAPSRFGCQIGAGLIAADVDELAAALATAVGSDGLFTLARWGETGIGNLTPLWLLKYLPNMLACHVTIIHDCQGPSNTITAAEASAGLSIAESMRVIQRGAADVCLSGGAEFKINPMGLLRQVYAQRLAATGPDVGDAMAIVRPYDVSACGTLLGEGGGLVVVESRDQALTRGARVYAEVESAAGAQCLGEDGAGVRIEEHGCSIAAAMRAAIARAGAAPEDIDAVAPMGSGIANVDRAEAAALHEVFGMRAMALPLITVMPNVGNCCAGAGAIAFAAAAKALHEQRLPARINTRMPIGLNAAAAASAPAELRRVLVLSIGMGGQCSAIVLRRAA